MKIYNIDDFSWDDDDPKFIKGYLCDDDPIYQLSSGDLHGTEFVIKGKFEDRAFIYDSVERNEISSILKFIQKFPYSSNIEIYIHYTDTD